MADETSSPPARPRELAVTKVDLPDLEETFADSIDNIFFDGQSMRIEFCVTRLEQVAKSPPRGRRYPACRLVLTPAAAGELVRQMNRFAAELVRAGVARQAPAQPAAAANTEKNKDKLM